MFIPPYMYGIFEPCVNIYMKPPKKSKLQKKLDDPNSRLWRNKADKAWRLLVGVQGEHKCAICGKTEFVQAHHLIPREMYSHRHIPWNGIMLCASHHKYSFEISPHKAPVQFFKWLIKERIATWNWVMEQTPSREHTNTFKDTATKLNETLSALTTLEIIPKQ